MQTTYTNSFVLSNMFQIREPIDDIPKYTENEIFSSKNVIRRKTFR